jgi:hypothetical protein
MAISVVTYSKSLVEKKEQEKKTSATAWCNSKFQLLQSVSIHEQESAPQWATPIVARDFTSYDDRITTPKPCSVNH